MTISDQKSDLRMYLQQARDVMIWKLDGLSDYDIRRPLTPTGTNLLGLVKHLTVEEVGYFGMTFERPHPAAPPWATWPNPVPNSHLWATEQESRDYIVGWYRKGWAHADETIDALDLDAIGHVPWWRGERSEVNLRRIMVHMIAETGRHAGHADIVRELIDGSAGLREGVSNLPAKDPAWWQDYRARLEQAAASEVRGGRAPA